MISDRTILVLGAGASAPFHYPVGSKLTERIKTELSEQQRGPLHGELISAGFSEELLSDFRNELRCSQRPSVDAFLEDWEKEFMDVGKAAIAASLMRHENQEWIVDSPDWYRRLFSEMTDAKSFSANQLGIVTFNYDRSLEYFFTRCLPSRYHVTPEKAVEWFSKIPIVHLYGSLGALPEYSSTGRAYGKGGSDAIIAASQGIHLARGGADPETFATARQMMSKASRIIVIGFGFEKINSARLGLMEFASSAQIYATTYKMCRVDQAVIQATHPPYKTPDEPEYSEDPYVEWFDGNALAFMEHHGIANPVE